MAIKNCLIKGYSGRCKVFNNWVLLTQYNLSVQTNIIQSQGSNKIFKNNKFERLKLNTVRDFPNITLSIAFQLTNSLVDTVLTKLSTYFRQSQQILFQDPYSGIVFKFEKAYVTSFNMSVSRDNLISVNFSFTIFQNKFDVWTSDESAKKGLLPTYGGEDKIPDLGVIPYYRFCALFNKIEYVSLLQFSLDFSVQLNPKYGCRGLYGYGYSYLYDYAFAPTHIIYSVPEIKFNLKSLLLNKGDFDNNYYSTYSNNFLSQKKDLQIKIYTSKVNYSSSSTELIFPYDYNIQNENKIIFEKCYPQTIVPTVGNASNVNQIQISYAVYGGIKFGSNDSSSSSSN